MAVVEAVMRQASPAPEIQPQSKECSALLTRSNFERHRVSELIESRIRAANVKAVQQMLGHASAAMTLDIYSDLFDDDLNAVSDRLDEAHQHSVVGKMWANQIANASDQHFWRNRWDLNSISASSEPAFDQIR